MSTTDKPTLSGEEQQQKITTYEEAFRRIKEATGVSDTMVRSDYSYTENIQEMFN